MIGLSPALSVVVVAYNMARELPRTLATLSPQMQAGGEKLDYEVIVVDNGSDPALAIPDHPWLSAVRISNASPSPAAAVNAGLAVARGALIGVLVDGARMASPGLLRHAILAARLDERPLITTIGFHLGPDVQMRSIHDGYDQATEDGLLASCGWERDGYQLFSIASFAGSSAGGWFAPIAETNALFMTPAMWAELGGYDERFESPGGGLVNLDAYARACHLEACQVIVLLGEGTFHQVHGGVATNAIVSPGEKFQAEYVSIRGKPFEKPDPDRVYVGRLPRSVMPSISESAK